MRRNFSLLVAVSITVLLGSTIPTEQALSEPNLDAPQPGSEAPAFAPGQILVKVEESAPAGALASVNRENDASVEEKIPDSRVSVVDLPADLSVAEAVEVYEDSPQIEYAEPDYVVHAEDAMKPDDPSFPKMYGLDNTGQYDGTPDADIDAPEAWGVTTGSPGTVVAVIDTGADISHPDLNDNVWTNPGEVPGNQIDDDHNGYVDDVNGWDFFYNDNSLFDTVSNDDHGTHVAGTIAAEGNNAVGVSGVSWQARVMPVKFLGPNGGYTSGAVKALDYAVANGATISNNSWGGFPYSQTMLDAIRRADAAGHLFVSSAGNAGVDTDASPHYPSGYDSPNVVSVAATNQNDSLATFSSNSGASNFGAASVDLAAPGDFILSTLPNNTYGYYEGTSMATPHVTGVATLIKAQSPELSATDIKARLLESVDKKPNLEGKTLSGGRLNAGNAIGAPPMITGWRPSPGKTIRDRTPLIRVTVGDDETELTADQIELYFDGQQTWDFTYDQVTDSLTYATGRVSFRRHSVNVVVDNGEDPEETRSWAFRVVRRR